jgi:hypothetical protein
MRSRHDTIGDFIGVWMREPEGLEDVLIHLVNWATDTGNTRLEMILDNCLRQIQKLEGDRNVD